MKLTSWYPPRIKPVRVGVYKTQLTQLTHSNNIDHFTGFSKWDGERWSDTRRSVKAASICDIEGMQTKTWCGLVKE